MKNMGSEPCATPEKSLKSTMDSKIQGSGEKQKYPRTLTNQQNKLLRLANQMMMSN